MITSWRLWQVLVWVVSLTCVALSPTSVGNTGAKVERVDVPCCYLFPGTKRADALNRLFAKGEKVVEVELVFRADNDGSVQPLMAGQHRVNSGWIKVFTRDGYVSYEPDKQFIVDSATGKRQRVDLGSPALGVHVFPDDPRVKKKGAPPAAYLVVDDSSTDYWRSQLQTVPLPMSQEGKKWIVRLKVQLSEDFDGKLGGWYVSRGK